MTFEELETMVAKATEDCKFLRDLQDRQRAKVAELKANGDTTKGQVPKYSPEWIADQHRTVRDEIETAATKRLATRGTFAALQQVRGGAEAQFSKAAVLSRASFLPGFGEYLTGTIAEQSILRELRQLREQTTADRWQAKVRDMSIDELREQFQTAVTTRASYAIASACLHEAERRSAANHREVAANKLSDAETKATEPVRSLPRELMLGLDEVPIYEADAALKLIADAIRLDSWIQSAQQSFSAPDLDDPGYRQQRIFEIRQQHPDADNETFAKLLADAGAPTFRKAA